MLGYLYGALLAIIQLIVVIVTLYMFASRLQKAEGSSFKSRLKNVYQQFKSAKKAILIIPSIILLALFALDGYIAMKFLEQKDADQVMNFLLLDKMHRNSDDLINDLSKEVKNFTDNHPEFNVQYKVEKQSKPSYEDMVVDQAFQVVLYAQRKDMAQDPELKKINGTLDNIDELRKEMSRIESTLSNPIKVQKGETHKSICQRYLKDEAKLDDKQIKSILNRTALFSSLIPKFYVYNLYKDGVFLTTVTQGEAKLSPMTVNMLAQRRRMSSVLKENNDLKLSLDSLRSTYKIDADNTEQ
ncbi:MAG: hypothetical protein Q8933_15200 [Bacteroidota bacterium]|nr:hypothetical protein [Bacteroidota bacterium]MDP4190503.1 hypothetical protein [Bacteroidota bacterium]